ncbi:MAG: hypothetical protein DWQ34_09860 [Planctomycetota bacterium]|nr:MAG: hypothetical protein DWQ34_09860 [Planctomycetota bacterium]REK21138.1 MAG: hypothetical protein DWQ41_22250 [Planctomycetota bacterium]REK29546.1 MAG: hypothetical protein DWQ45_22285 [Planctomycetota bacterium]
MKLENDRKADRQYTVRSVPERLDRELRKRARLEQKSLNRLIIEILSNAVSPDAIADVNHRLDRYSGSWVDDAEFDAAMQELDGIDEEIWQ